MYAVMWSEHCSYKSSRVHLKRLPTEGSYVLVGPGENAGVVDAGGGLAVALRIESHNHPSAIEPYQGAATGVGGILRDIFTMGARPIALMDALRFGPPDDARSRWIATGVIAGISGYGNSVGVPTVGGEIVFDDCYADNPLVNVLCCGVLPVDRLVLGRASGEGNLAILLGSPTGRDGIGGVSILASAGFGEAEAETAKRPNVQVGDPFEEKRLIEACLQLLDERLVRGNPGPGRGGTDLCDQRDGLPRSGRDGCRRDRGTASRAGHGALGSHDERESGTDARHRHPGCRESRPGGVPPVGGASDGHRSGDQQRTIADPERLGWRRAGGHPGHHPPRGRPYLPSGPWPPRTTGPPARPTTPTTRPGCPARRTAAPTSCASWWTRPGFTANTTISCS